MWWYKDNGYDMDSTKMLLVYLKVIKNCESFNIILTNRLL